MPIVVLVVLVVASSLVLRFLYVSPDEKPATPIAAQPATSTTTPLPAPTASSLIFTNSLCQVDSTLAPDQVSRAKEMAAVCQAVFPLIEQRLSVSPNRAPHRIVFDYNQYAAYTESGVVHVSINWLRHSPYDPGLLPHELTHVVQNYSGAPSWLTEGIATDMSYQLGYSVGIAHCGAGEHYTSGYGCAASLLDYVERVYRASIVLDVHKSLRARTYSDDMFTRETGKSLPTLYAECRLAECQGGRP